MSGVYNNWLKVQNPNVSNEITPMKSGGFQEPFYFGGSQVPYTLGVDNSISGKGIKSYKKSSFLPETIKGKGIPKTEFNSQSNIHLPRHLKMI